MHSWRIIYPMSIYQEKHDPIWSIMLINTNISTNMYTTLDIPSGDIMAICLKGNYGHCSIFNIHNNCMNNNVTMALHDYLSTHNPDVLPSPTDHMLWLGNFNRHHLLWEPNDNRHLHNSANMINPLLDLVMEYNMILTLPPNIPTYETATSNWTCPNNMWCNNNPDDPITICNVDPSIHPPQANHLPMITELDLSIHRASTFPTCNMHDTDFKTINKKLQALLANQCPAQKICSEEDLENTVNTLVRLI